MVKLYLGGFPKSFERAIGDVCLEYGFSTVKSEANADLRVLVDPKNLRELDLWRDVVVLAEPEVVRPDLYRNLLFSKVSMVLPLGRYRAERLGLTNWIDFPVELPTYEQVWVPRNTKIALVNEHKFSSSFRSKYGLRRKVIHYLEREYPGTLDLFGNQWNDTKTIEVRRRVAALRNFKTPLDIDLNETFSNLWHVYESHAGHMDSECKLLKEYRLSICIENDIDYVSEKVWKSLYAGCPVIYVGPNLDYDKELLQCVTLSAATVSSVISALESMDERTEKHKSQAGIDFLKSSTLSLYSANNRAHEFCLSLLKIAGI